MRYVGNVVIDRLAEALADDETLVEIQIRLAGAQRHEVSVFVVLFPVKIGAEALLGTGNGHIAVVAVYRLIFEAYHGVFVNKRHAGLECLKVVSPGLELSRAVGKLLCAGSKFAFAAFERLLSGCEILLALRKLLFGLGQLLLSGCKLCLAGFKLLQAVFVLLEHSLALCHHVLNIGREIGHVCRDGKAQALGNRCDLADKPCLRAVKAGQLCDAAVAEFDIGVQQRHERLDLSKKRLALVVGVGVRVDHRLTCRDLCAPFLKRLFAGGIVFVALRERGLALVIVFIALSKSSLASL